MQAGDHPGRQRDDQLREGAVVFFGQVAPASSPPAVRRPLSCWKSGAT
jgi:hypothetical protein